MRKLVKDLKGKLRGKPRPESPGSLVAASTSTSGTIVASPPGSPTPSPSLPSFPAGLKELHRDATPLADICFIHGLTGDRERTWRAEGSSLSWPQTLLPDAIKHVRVLTFGYDAYFMGRKSGASGNGLLDHANDLVGELAMVRSECPDRPIVFVTHSLGGLLCKVALLDCQNHDKPAARAVLTSTRGVVFMGTPHRGSSLADWAKPSLTALGLLKSTNTKLVQTLRADDQYLDSIQTNFLKMARRISQTGTAFNIVCFFEELPTPVAGFVVPKASATLDGYPVYGIHANHRTMAKFGSTDDRGFQKLIHELRAWIPKTPLPAQEAQIRIGQDQLSCLRVLGFRQMTHRLNDVAPALEGTCRWLLSHKTYQEWVASDRSILWIRGKPGSGKSTLMKFALADARAKATSKTITLAFFFHGRGDELQKTPMGLWRSLLHEMLKAFPTALDDLVQVCKDRMEAQGEAGEAWQWHPDELQRFFVSALPRVLQSHPVQIFVDAVDECGELHARALVRQFKLMFRTLSNTTASLQQCRLCFSCRHYPILSQDGVLELNPEFENETDISKFVHEELSDFTARGATRIPQMIASRANGVFLWAHLVVRKAQDLELEGSSDQQIMDAIEETPDELEKLYRQLIESMLTPSTLQTSLRLIRWICFARTSLRLEELRWALVIDPFDPRPSLLKYKSESFYTRTNEQMKQQLKTFGRGLAEVSQPSDKYEGLVQFIHQSVKDVFLQEGLMTLASSSNPEDTSTENQHHLLCLICLRYLETEEIGALSNLQGDDLEFLTYATTQWFYHAAIADAEDGHQEDILAMFEWPLCPPDNLMDRWLRAYSLVEMDSFSWPEGTSLVHVAAKQGLVRLMTAIVQHEACVNLDIKDGLGRTPLAYAITHNHKPIVQILLETKRVNVNGSGNMLNLAVANENEEIIKLLLDIGKADPNLRLRLGHTPLLQAAKKGLDKIVAILLATGVADANAGLHGYKPIIAAAKGGHSAVTRLLCNAQGVDFNAKDPSFHRTALSWAAREGYEDIVEMLLETGKVDVETRDVTGRTALSLAAGNGHVGPVKLLLELGMVEPDAIDGEGCSPLLWAVRGRWLAIALLILETGKIDVDTRDAREGRTALSWAVCDQEGYELVKLLLGREKADPETRDFDGRTPLSHAAEKGDEAVVRLLLGNDRVVPDAKDAGGRTPLSWAAMRGREDSARVLLESERVEVNSRDDEDHSPLWWTDKGSSGWWTEYPEYLRVVELLQSFGGSR